MAVINARKGLEPIPMLGCMRHLRTETIGRVAVMVDGHPEIFPVNYAFDGRDVVRSIHRISLRQRE